MTNDLQVFSYNGQQVRTVEQDGGIWFVAKDVCDILGLNNARKAVSALDDDEKMTVTNSYSHSGQRGGAQFLNLVSEPGVYKLIFKSRKTEAKDFTRWVTHEVLPQIHKYGMYLTDKTLVALKKDPEAFERVLKLYADSQSEVRGLRKELESSHPYTNLGLAVLSQKGSVTFQSGAQFLAQHGIPIGQNRLFRYCREKGLLCSRRGRQYNKPTQRAIERGLFNLEVSGGFYAITLITPQGLMNLTNMLAHENYPLLMLMETAQGETE